MRMKSACLDIRLRKEALSIGATMRGQGGKGKTGRGSEEGACSPPRVLRGRPRGQACSKV